MAEQWRDLARAQSGVLARRQLTGLGVTWSYVRHRVTSERWQQLSPSVLATTTGPLSHEQRLWFAALHCGGDSLVGGLTAAAVHGLRGWARPDVCVLVDDDLDLDLVAGLDVVRTRRPLAQLRDPRSELPLCRLEPAVLLWAAYQRSHRTALGLLAACVQQRLTTPEQLRRWVLLMRPLRWSKPFQRALGEIAGGAHSMAELDLARMCRRFGLASPDRQVRRRGCDGRLRYTDAEWRLGDGRVVVLEVDGAFHMDVGHWEDDLVRERSLVGGSRIVVRASAREVRDSPDALAADLHRLGVPGRGSQTALRRGVGPTTLEDHDR